MIVFPHLGYVGRLGNALFQLAATIGLGARHNTEVLFNADWIHRPYFSVPDELFGTPGELSQTSNQLAHELVPHIDPRAAIYLQDVNLFLDVLPTIRQYLRPSARAEDILNEYGPTGEESIMSAIERLPRPILSVHVRRGDNVPGQDPGVPNKADYYVLPGIDYYTAAIADITDHYPYNSIAVFSDEPDWCEKQFPFTQYIHHGITRPKEHETDFLTAPVLDWIDLQLMAACDRHVVTGSTFGIWGALLAGDMNAVRPTPVYGPALPYINEDLMFPATWKKLPVRC